MKECLANQARKFCLGESLERPQLKPLPSQLKLVLQEKSKILQDPCKKMDILRPLFKILQLAWILVQDSLARKRKRTFFMRKCNKILGRLACTIL